MAAFDASKWLASDPVLEKSGMVPRGGRGPTTLVMPNPPLQPGESWVGSGDDGGPFDNVPLLGGIARTVEQAPQHFQQAAQTAQQDWSKLRNWAGTQPAITQQFEQSGGQAGDTGGLLKYEVTHPGQALQSGFQGLGQEMHGADVAATDVPSQALAGTPYEQTALSKVPVVGGLVGQPVETAAYSLADVATGGGASIPAIAGRLTTGGAVGAAQAAAQPGATGASTAVGGLFGLGTGALNEAGIALWGHFVGPIMSKLTGPLKDQLAQHLNGITDHIQQLRDAGEHDQANAVQQQTGDTLRQQASRLGFEAPGGGPGAARVTQPQVMTDLGISQDEIERALAGGVGDRMPINDMKIDPERFQHRKMGVNPNTGSAGRLANVKKFTPGGMGEFTVWQDLQGDRYVVNGHNRRARAVSEGYGQHEANVFVLKEADGVSAPMARAVGAVQNMMSGTVEPYDVASFLKELGPDGARVLDEMGVDTKKEVFQQGEALAGLGTQAWNRYLNNEIPLNKAVTMGRGVPGSDSAQSALLSVLTPKTKDDEWQAMVDMAAQDAGITETQNTLFGETTSEKSTFVNKAKLMAVARDEIGSGRRLYGGKTANEATAAKLAQAGNVLNVAENAKRAADSSRALTTFNLLFDKAGPIANALNDGAARLTKGENADGVRTETIDRIHQAIEAEWGRGVPEPGSPTAVPGAPEVHPAQPPAPGESAPAAAGTPAGTGAESPAPTAVNLFGEEQALPQPEPVPGEPTAAQPPATPTPTAQAVPAAAPTAPSPAPPTVSQAHSSGFPPSNESPKQEPVTPVATPQAAPEPTPFRPAQQAAQVQARTGMTPEQQVGLFGAAPTPPTPAPAPVPPPAAPNPQELLQQLLEKNYKGISFNETDVATGIAAWLDQNNPQALADPQARQSFMKGIRDAYSPFALPRIQDAALAGADLSPSDVIAIHFAHYRSDLQLRQFVADEDGAAAIQAAWENTQARNAERAVRTPKTEAPDVSRETPGVVRAGDAPGLTQAQQHDISEYQDAKATTGAVAELGSATDGFTPDDVRDRIVNDVAMRTPQEQAEMDKMPRFAQEQDVPSVPPAGFRAPTEPEIAQVMKAMPGLTRDAAQKIWMPDETPAVAPGGGAPPIEPPLPPDGQSAPGEPADFGRYPLATKAFPLGEYDPNTPIPVEGEVVDEQPVGAAAGGGAGGGAAGGGGGAAAGAAGTGGTPPSGPGARAGAAAGGGGRPPHTGTTTATPAGHPGFSISRAAIVRANVGSVASGMAGAIAVYNADSNDDNQYARVAKAFGGFVAGAAVGHVAFGGAASALPERLRDFYIGSILAPTTAGTKAFSDVVGVIKGPMVRAVTALYSGRLKSFGAEGAAMSFGYFKGIIPGLMAAVHELDPRYVSSNASGLFGHTVSTGSAPGIGQLSASVVPRLLSAITQFSNVVLAHGYDAANMAASKRGYTNLPSADKEALYDLLMDTPKTWSGRAVQGMLDFLQRGPTDRTGKPFMKGWAPIGHVVAPFKTIPANLVEQVVNWMPGIGLVNLIGADDKTKVLAAQSLAVMATMGLAHAFGKNVNGAGPTDPKLRRAWFAQHNQPYTVQLPGSSQWVSMQHLPQALRGPLMAWASYVDTTKWGGSSAQALSEIGGSLQGLDFFPMIAQLITDPSSMKFLASSQISSFIPWEVRDAARGERSTQADISSKYVPNVQTAVQRGIRASIPGVEKSVPSSIDALGHPVVNPYQGVGGVINPFRPNYASNNPTVNTLENYGTTPGTAPSTLVGQQTTPEQRYAFMRQADPLVSAEVAAVQRDPRFAQMTAAQKTTALHDAYLRGRQKADIAFLNTNPGFQGKTAGNRPLKYAGITTAAQEALIDDAIRTVQNYARDRQHNPPPTAQQSQLARGFQSRVNPAYRTYTQANRNRALTEPKSTAPTPVPVKTA